MQESLPHSFFTSTDIARTNNLPEDKQRDALQEKNKDSAAFQSTSIEELNNHFEGIRVKAIQDYFKGCVERGVCPVCGNADALVSGFCSTKHYNEMHHISPTLPESELVDAKLYFESTHPTERAGELLEVTAQEREVIEAWRAKRKNDNTASEQSTLRASNDEGTFQEKAA